MKYKIKRRVKVHGPGPLWQFEKGQVISAGDYPGWVPEYLVQNGYAAPIKDKAPDVETQAEQEAE